MEDDYYRDNYKSINVTGDISNTLAKVMHRFLESDRDSLIFENVLEVGALNGEHTHFVRHGFSQYYVTDIRSPSQATIESLENRGFLFQLANVEKLPFEDNFFDRIVSTCLLHHLESPAAGIDEMLRVVKRGGTIDILLPNDPSLVYSGTWLVTTGLKALLKKRFIESFRNRKNEHIQELKSIVELLDSNKKIFLIEKKSFPSIFKSNALSALFRYTITKS